MGLFDIFRANKNKRTDVTKIKQSIDENGNTSTTVYGFISNDISTPNAMTPEEAAILQKKFIEQMVPGNNLTNKGNFAASLMLSGQYELCIKAYEEIAEQHPEKQGDCESQIGAALYFLGRYGEAIIFYKQALAHGADAEMMRDNIEEAEEAISQNAG